MIPSNCWSDGLHPINQFIMEFSNIARQISLILRLPSPVEGSDLSMKSYIVNSRHNHRVNESLATEFSLATFSASIITDTMVPIIQL